MALGLLIAAATADLLWRRVPNELCILGMITGVYVFACGDGNGGGLQLIWRMLWPFLLLYVLYLIGGLGAGDVKLMVSLSLYFPGKFTLQMFFLSFVMGAVVGGFRLIRNRQLQRRCVSFLQHLQDCYSTKQLSAYDSSLTTVNKLHFAVYLLCAAILSLPRGEFI